MFEYSTDNRSLVSKSKVSSLFQAPVATKSGSVESLK